MFYLPTSPVDADNEVAKVAFNFAGLFRVVICEWRLTNEHTQYLEIARVINVVYYSLIYL